MKATPPLSSIKAADQLQWLARVGQIVITLGGDWNCERLFDNDDEELSDGE